jgi:hypothetical protein
MLWMGLNIRRNWIFISRKSVWEVAVEDINP